jgi:hypothetical protein
MVVIKIIFFLGVMPHGVLGIPSVLDYSAASIIRVKE